MADAWKDVAAQLAQLGLPVLGRVLGGYIPIVGPIFGNSVGESVGGMVAEMIAKTLGVAPTPTAISSAIESGPTSEVVSRLQAIEAEATARWPALAEIAKVETQGEVEVAKINAETNAQAVKEVSENSFWQSLYRSILMYAATFNLSLFGLVFFYAMLLDADLWRRLVEGKDMVAWWLGANASVLGFHFYTRGKEREAAVTGAQTNSPVANAIKAVAPKPALKVR